MPVSLAAASNRSMVPASINRLPPETLARIFRFSKTYCVCDNGFQINGLTGVCVYWRQIALEIANLWTHVDVSLQTPRRLIELLLDRSKTLPIHVHFFSLEPQEETIDEVNNAQTEYPIGDTIVVLEPQLRRVCTLSITSSTYRWHFVFAVLNAWSDHDNAGLLKSLEVDRSRAFGTYVLGISKRNRNIEKMLLGTGTLYLRSTVFQWDSDIYSGLVDLQLDFDNDVFIPLSRLANILAVCPALSILKLTGLRVRGVANWVRPSIVMEHLECINLTDMKPDDASSVLSLITLPGPRAELGVSISRASKLDDKLADFFARSKITTLFHASYTCEFECDSCLNYQDCEAVAFCASKFFP
ncbi:hypothetical protein FRC09_000718, partial [Ceratobasidium sp. 395]